MKVIFLDVDGVLNNDKTTSKTPGGWIGVSNTLVDRLLYIVKMADAKVVLTSTWKHSDQCELDYLYTKLKNAKPVDRTYDPEDRDSMRGQGINSYLKDHPEVEEFVILDDYSFDFKEQKLLSHCILTDEKVGLTDDDMWKAIKVLNGRLVPEGYYEWKYMW